MDRSSLRTITTLGRRAQAIGLAALLLAAPGMTGADEKGAMAGTVTSRSGDAVGDATVSLVNLRRHTRTDRTGAFRFEDVPAGRHLVQVVSPRYGSAVVEAEVEPGAEVSIDVRLDITVHQEQVVVSAAPEAGSLSAVAQPVSVLDQAALQARVQPTLGETLASEPGVASSSYSPGVSRPIIRGLGGDRIRILENGIGVADASSVSADHAVAADASTAERVEIVRGAATLMYGSSAIGGVVNVINNRVPDHVPTRPLVGTAQLLYGSAAEEKSGSLSLDGGGGQFAWHVDGSSLDAGDLDTPEGALVNSAVRTGAGTAGGSWATDKGFLGASYGRYETRYGVPTDEMIRIDLEQDRYDLRGEYNRALGIFRAAKFRMSRTDYEHAELAEDGTVGTRFLNDTWEGRLELPHRAWGPMQGAFGIQAGTRDLEAIGDEAFLPPTRTENQALFAVEDFGRGKVTYNLGGRFERQRTSARATAGFPSPGPDRDFDAFSAAAGIVIRPHDAHSIAATLSRTARPPNAEELYANGPHLATFQFEVGDPDLDRETGLSLDVSLARREGIVHGQLDLFAARFDDYIFLNPTGALVDVDGELIPEFAYIQADADFYGAELHVDVELFHQEPHHLQLEIHGDHVRAELRDSGEPLPRIPPLRYGLGLRYRGSRLGAMVEARRTATQDRVAGNEEATKGFTFVNASLSYRIFAGETVHDLLLSGINLTDRLGRNHVSALKEFVPLTGREVRLSYRLTF